MKTSYSTTSEGKARESKFLWFGFALVIVMILFASCDTKPASKSAPATSQGAAIEKTADLTSTSEKADGDNYAPLQDPTADPEKQNAGQASALENDDASSEKIGAEEQQEENSSEAAEESTTTSEDQYAPLQDPTADPEKQNAGQASALENDDASSEKISTEEQQEENSSEAAEESTATSKDQYAPLQDPTADPEKQNAGQASVLENDDASSEKIGAEGQQEENSSEAAEAPASTKVETITEETGQKVTEDEKDLPATVIGLEVVSSENDATNSDGKHSITHITVVKEGEKSPLVEISEAQDLNKKGPDQVKVPENVPAAKALDNLGNEVAQLEEASAVPNNTAAMTELVIMGNQAAATPIKKVIPPNEQKVIKLRGSTMGTYWQVLVAYPLNNTEQSLLREQIEGRLSAVNQSMSTYINDSELSRFNSAQTTDPVEISPELRTVIAESLKISEQSGGMYDVTVEPLVELWGFGPKRPTHAPTDAEIQTALAKVGYDKLNLTETGLSKSNPETAIDLSSIAKGYGVDQVGAVIRKAGYENFLVDIGGEILAGGDKYGKAWTVAIETPKINGSNDYQSVLPLGGQLKAIATSGNYRNFINYGGVHAVHTVNPKTGQTEQSKLLSASVISDNCMLADGYATALMALGEDQAFEFAETNNLAAVLIFSGSDTAEFEIKRSSAFIREFGEKQ